MMIGEIVEALIRLHDSGRISQTEDDTVCSACNILDKLPRMMDEETAKDTIRQITAEYRRNKMQSATT